MTPNDIKTLISPDKLGDFIAEEDYRRTERRNALKNMTVS